jgi:iron complex outermembrane receptor protein
MAFRSPGLAQTKDTTETLKNYEIEEVIVTGTRTERKIIDIPYPTLLIDNAEYRFERKTAVNDVMEAVPGLFMQSRYGNHDVRISIRGFGSRSNTGIRGVRILLDGIPESEPDGQTRIEAIDFQSVGKIEIVKGNASSLYTNAPGGVINFINDIYFPGTFATAFGETGSNGYRSYGLKTGVKTDQYRFLMTYNRHVADGYRPHSDDEWHIVNSVVETKPSDLTRLSVFTNYANGEIRLPGSLTRAQYDEDPFQANARDVARDAFRLTKKGRLGLKFEVFSGEGPTPNQLEVTGYLTSKYFHRTARTYRIFDRQGIGGSARYVYHLPLFGRHNELSVGGDAYFQSGPISEFDNINGEKGDILEGLTDETISNAGLYFQNSFNLIKDKSDLLITGRYDGVVFESRNQVLEVQNAKRKFDAFTPKAALNYKLTPTIAAYTSYGLGFDTPAGNELDNYPTSSNPYPLLNPDLKPQKSRNFELGIKGNVVEPDRRYFRDLFFEATLFHIKIEDEIVPFEVFGDVFYRNSARTNRTGMEIGANAEVLKGLRWKTAYTFSDFTYGSYVARTIELDSVGNIVAIDRSFNGNAVPSVPKHNLSLAVSYEHEIVRHVTGFAKLSYLAISGMQVDDGNTEKSAGYQLLNSTIGIDMTFDRFNVLATAGINNLTDREYVAFININSATGEFYEAGEPRAFFAGVNLGYRF